MWNFEQHGNHIAFLSDTGTEVKYKHLEEDSTALAVLLTKKSLVLIACSNTIGAAVGYACFIQTKNTCFMVDAEKYAVNTTDIIHRWKPEYVWVPLAQAEDTKYPVVWQKYGYVLLKTAEANPACAIHEDLALLLTTSGTTNSVTYCRISYSNLVLNTASIQAFLNLQQSDRSISTLPLHYTYGLSVINTHLMVGGSVYMTEKKMTQRAFWECVRTASITNINGVPFHYEVMYKLNVLKHEWPNLYLFTQAGGKLQENLQYAFADTLKKQGKRFFIMYGQTECTARISYLPVERAGTKMGSVGLPVPGTTLTLIDEHGLSVNTPNILGEIRVEGDCVFMGYASNREDLSKGYENSRQLATGDLGWVDEDGFLYIQGRMKRCVKLLGERVNMDELELMVSRSIQGVTVACTGNDNSLTLYYSGSVTPHTLRTTICRLIGLHVSVITCIQLDELPVKASGKIDYQYLEKLA